MRRHCRPLPFAPALLALIATVPAQPIPLRAQEPTPTAIDGVFAPWDRPGSPGCALGVLRSGEFVYQRGYAMELAGIRLQDVFTDQEAIALRARQRELNFPPGTEHLYSNSGYFLLGQLVKRVTGRSLREYAAEQIFRPLGMDSTHFHDQPWTVVGNRAISYQPEGAGFRISYLAFFDKAGAGGLYTTLGDLARWDANFYQLRVGDERWLRTLLTPGVLADGDTLSYAFGLTLGRLLGRPVVRHGGAMMGFRADLLRFPEERLTR